MESFILNTNMKVKIYFTIAEFSATKIIMRECHVDESDKGTQGMILGIDLLI